MFACSKNIVSQAASPIVLISYAISEEKLFRALPGRLFWDHDQHDLSYLPGRSVGGGGDGRPLPRLGDRPRRRLNPLLARKSVGSGMCASILGDVGVGCYLK